MDRCQPSLVLPCRSGLCKLVWRANNNIWHVQLINKASSQLSSAICKMEAVMPFHFSKETELQSTWWKPAWEDMPGNLDTNYMAFDWKFEHLLRTNESWKWKNKAFTKNLQVSQAHKPLYTNRKHFLVSIDCNILKYCLAKLIPKMFENTSFLNEKKSRPSREKAPSLLVLFL